MRGLSVFVGPFTLEAALAVAACQGIGEAEAVEAISNLLSKSLIATSPAERRLRYRLLDTTRAFAGDKLVESGEAARVARAHAEYFRDFLHDICAQIHGHAQRGRLSSLCRPSAQCAGRADLELFGGGDRAIGVDLAASAAQFFLELTLLTECYRWTQQALASADTRSTAARK